MTTDVVNASARPGHVSLNVARELASSGRIAFVAALGVVAAVAATTYAVVLAEGTRDWTIYQHAAERLASGEPLYLFQQSAAREAYFLYPPLMAAIWPLVGGPEALLTIKLIVLIVVGALTGLLPVTGRLERAAAGAGLYGAAILVLPNLHDMALGNVMLLYVSAISLVLVVKGWPGAVLLGGLLALAAKPVIVPFLIWLAIRRRDDAMRVVAAAAAASLLGAAAAGIGQYVAYIEALPAMSALLGLQGGNAGLSSVGPLAVLGGLVIGSVATIWTAARTEALRGAAVAIASGLLVQPTLGLNYGGVLLPAAVCLWAVDRVAGFAAFVTLPILVVSPPAAAAVLVGLALAGPVRLMVRGGAGTEPSPK